MDCVLWLSDPAARGRLRPECKDHWYRYLPEDRASTDAAITEAMADIDVYVLPFFAQRSWRERAVWLVAAQISRLLPRRSEQAGSIGNSATMD
jgi:hypothetical protein